MRPPRTALGALLAVLAVGCGGQAEPAAAPAAPAAVQQQARQAPAQAPVRAAPVKPPAAVAIAAQVRAALSARSWPAGLDPAKAAGAPEWTRDRCLDVSARNKARCTYGPPGAIRDVAVLGDSIAAGWLPALRRAPTLRDARIHPLTRRQCPNARGVVRPGCSAHQDWALQQVRALRPDLIVLSSRYSGDRTWTEWQAGIRRMLTAVSPYTDAVVLLPPPPDTADVRDCLRRKVRPSACGLVASRDWHSHAYAEQQAAKVTGARFIDPRPWFCVDDRCPAVVGGVPVTFDGRHLNGAYAARLGPALSDALVLAVRAP